jgi:hypothetical protein
LMPRPSRYACSLRLRDLPNQILTLLGPWVLTPRNHAPPSANLQRTDRSLYVTKDNLLQLASCLSSSSYD